MEWMARGIQPCVSKCNKNIVDQAGDVLAGGYAGDRPGQDVVEHQAGDADLGQRSAQRLFHHAIHAAAHEHGAAFDVDGADGEGEQHDAQDEPRGGFPDGLLGDAAGIKSRRAEIVQVRWRQLASRR